MGKKNYLIEGVSGAGKTFDGVFVLDIDSNTLIQRLKLRPEDEWGGKPAERELALRLLQTKEDLPKNGIIIDSTKPLTEVVDEIIRDCIGN